MKHLILVSVLLLITGCKIGRNQVIAGSETVIGLSVSQNPSTQLYQAKLGYNRTELAIVPSSISSNKVSTADVMMEIRYGSIFSFSSASIYQKLAIGTTAVSQPGAALMFARDQAGNINTQSLSAVLSAQRQSTNNVSN